MFFEKKLVSKLLLQNHGGGNGKACLCESTQSKGTGLESSVACD